VIECAGAAIGHLLCPERRLFEQWKDTNKCVVNFAKPAIEFGPIKLVAKGIVKAPQGPLDIHQRQGSSLQKPLTKRSKR
jgi:hypothetical protein